MSDLVGKSLGRYRIVEALGEGGMASVFKAYDTRLERYVAVKVIRTDFNRSDDFLKRFEREAKALAQLTHPYIVHINDYGDEEGLPYLVMDFIPGGTLKQKIQAPIPYQQAVKLLLPVAHALEYAHSMKIIHRDVKPANILLTTGGQPMLSDFGLAKILEQDSAVDLTGTGMGIGTPEYMAPEQWLGKFSPQTDIYALGVVFYELVTGRRPYTADTPVAILLKQANDPLPRPATFVPGLPDEVEALIFKALAKEPADRYADMGQLIAAFERLERVGKTIEVLPPSAGVEADAVPETVVVKPAEPVEPSRAPSAQVESLAVKAARRRFPGWIFLVLAVLAAVLVVAGILFIRNRSVPQPASTQESIPAAAVQTQPPFGGFFLVQEDFTDARFDGKWNPELWAAPPLAADRIIRQEGGVLRMALPATEKERLSLNLTQSWQASKMNYVEVRFKVNAYEGWGQGSAVILLDPHTDQWMIDCTFEAPTPQLSCGIQSGTDERMVFISGLPLQYDTWYNLAYWIDPQNFAISVYLDGRLVKTYVPEQVEKWKTAPLGLSLALSGKNTSAGLEAAFDRVLVGDRFSSAVAAPAVTPTTVEMAAVGSELEQLLHKQFNEMPIHLRSSLFVGEMGNIKTDDFSLFNNSAALTVMELISYAPLSMDALTRTPDIADAQPLEIPAFADGSAAYRGRFGTQPGGRTGIVVRFKRENILFNLVATGAEDRLSLDALVSLAKTINQNLPSPLPRPGPVSAPAGELDTVVADKYVAGARLGEVKPLNNTFTPQTEFRSGAGAICVQIELKRTAATATLAVYQLEKDLYWRRIDILMPLPAGTSTECIRNELGPLQLGSYQLKLWIEGRLAAVLPFEVN